MGRSAQRKGRAAEVELAGKLRDLGFADAQPGPPVSFGSAPDVVGIDGVHVECKSVRNLNLPAALRQAAEDAQYFADGLPVVFHKHPRQGWVASMSLGDWALMCHAAASADG